MKVLFTNAGRRTYLIEFAMELRRQGYPVDILVSDCTHLIPTFHVAPEVETVLLPRAHDDREAYLRALVDIATQRRLDAIIPLSDLDQDTLAAHKAAFLALGTLPVVPAPEVVARCMDKKLAYEYCLEVGIPKPTSWFTVKEFGGFFPCIQKHILGSGGSGFAILWNAGDLAHFEEGRDMLQTLVQGVEYGVDILNDLNGDFVACCVKKKLLMRAGETDRAVVVRHPKVEALARRIGETFRHVGNLDVDIMEASDGSLYCMDFNPRFGGGYPATHLAGMNYLKAVFDMIRGLPVSLPAEPRPITVMKGLSLYWFEGEWKG